MVLTVFTKVNTVIKSKSMSLYQVEWVFRYLPVVLTVFTKVNQSKSPKVCHYTKWSGYLDTYLSPYSFTKVNHSHKVQKYVIIPSRVGIIYLPVVLTVFT